MKKAKQKTVKLWVGRDTKTYGYLYCIGSKKMKFWNGGFHPRGNEKTACVCDDWFYKVFDLYLEPGEQVQIEVPQVKCKILKRLPKEK